MAASEFMREPLLIRYSAALGRPVHCQEFGFTPTVEGAPINQLMGAASWITSHLFCCHQNYLVLSRDDSDDRRRIHVWRVVEEEEERGTSHSIEFIRTMEPETSDAVELQDVVVTEEDSRLYLLWYHHQSQDGTQHSFYKIEAHDLANGNVVATTTVNMPLIPQERPRYFATYLVAMENHVVLLRHYEQSGRFPGTGVGAYSFRRSDLIQTHYLPCFDKGEIHIEIDKSRCASKYVRFSDFASVSFNRLLAVNKSTGGLTIEDHTPMEQRGHCVLMTTHSLYVTNHDEDMMHLDQYDLMTRQKVRSLKIGFGRSNSQYMLATTCVNRKRRELVAGFAGPQQEPRFLVWMLESV